MKHFANANEVLLIADSQRKADIVKQVVEGEITNAVPASLLRNVEGSVLYVDEDAAQKLKL